MHISKLDNQIAFIKIEFRVQIFADDPRTACPSVVALPHSTEVHMIL